MRIVISGGTGFIGRHVAFRLHRAGHDVIALGRNRKLGDQLKKQGVSFAEVELRDTPGLIAATRRADAIVHCAGLASPWGAYEKFFEANVTGTENILSACQKNQISRLLHFSTPSLYFDFNPRLQIKENEPLPAKAHTSYAATKQIADERVLKSQSPKFHVTLFRPRAVFGPGDTTVLGRILKMASRGTMILAGKGNAQVDFTYVSNVVDCVETWIGKTDLPSGGIYNITNGEPMEIKLFLDKLFHSLDWKVKFLPIPWRMLDILASGTETIYRKLKIEKEPFLTRYAAGLMGHSQTLSIERAKKDLNYSPSVSLEEGIRRFVSWWRLEQSPNREKGAEFRLAEAAI